MFVSATILNERTLHSHHTIPQNQQVEFYAVRVGVSQNRVELSGMLKKLIFFGAFFGPFILAGVLYFSIDSGADRCNQFFDQMTTSIEQANFCAVDADCKPIDIHHPNYGCSDALVNSGEAAAIAAINKTVTENGCRLHLQTTECELPSADTLVARCADKQCTWSSRSAE